jgi:hypothetical protein
MSGFKILQTVPIDQNKPIMTKTTGQKNTPCLWIDAGERIISSEMQDPTPEEVVPVLQAWSQPSAAARPCVLDAVKFFLSPSDSSERKATAHFDT